MLYSTAPSPTPTPLERRLKIASREMEVDRLLAGVGEVDAWQRRLIHARVETLLDDIARLRAGEGAC